MNKYFLEVLLEWPRSYISGTDLCHLLDRSPNSRFGIIKRSIQAGYLVQLRRDLYLIKKLGKPLVDNFELAGIIYGPSYISFESALSFHGWIPEAVRTTTSATPKRKKEFETPIGLFSYETVPMGVFAFEVMNVSTKRSVQMIASPLKAIADLSYARKRSWKSIDELCGDLRIEREHFQRIDPNLIQELIENYPSERVKEFLAILLKGINQ